MSEMLDPAKLKVAELRAELQARGLDAKGNKPVLVERLREALEAEAQDGGGNESMGGGGAAVEEQEQEQEQEEEEEEDMPQEEEPVEELQEEEEQEENTAASRSPSKLPASSPTKEPVKDEPESLKTGYEEGPVEDVAMMNGGYPTPGTKRCSDDLLSETAEDSNGSLTSPATGSNSNEAKKVKLERKNHSDPSRVIHIRNIPNEVTEAEIVHLGTPFGRVTNVLVLKGKNQAFLEMADEECATSMVEYFSGCTARLRGYAVYVQFSKHKELKMDHSSASAKAAMDASEALIEKDKGANTILRVIVDNMIYSVTLDVLYQIFSRVGKVLKIVTFIKNDTFQALIQYPDVVTAQAARMTLDGQNVYNACCTLRIDYSKLTNLNIKYNNDKSWDYTIPNQGDQDSDMGRGGMGRENGSQRGMLYGGHLMGGMNSTAAALGAAGIHVPGHYNPNGCVLLVSNLNEVEVTPDAIFTLFGLYGDVLRVKIMYNKKDNALVQMSEPHQTQLAISHLDRVRAWGKQIRVSISRHNTVQLPKPGQADGGLTKDFSSSPLHRFKKPGSKNYQNIYPPSATLHLSNIPPNIEEEQLTEAFAETGVDVVAFKFFPKDRKMALIQLGSVEEAIEALVKMHNYKLSSSSHLRVSFSKSTI